MLKHLVAVVLFFSFWGISISQTSIILNPVMDNTIIQESGDESLGKSEFIFAGRTGSLNGNNSRRALILFDLSAIPSNAIIESAALELAIILAPNENTHTMRLHRLTASWGEGNSGANVSRGAGEQADDMDATWTHRFYNTIDVWSQNGGDFISTASASSSVQFIDMPTIPKANWNSSGMASDVQAWLDGSAANHGWILIGDENTTKSAKKFIGTDNTSIFFPKPKLTIQYSLPGATLSKTPIINEVNLQDQWIEFYNCSDETFDLSTWSICEDTSCDTIGGSMAPFLHGDASLEPGEYTVISWSHLDTISGEIALQSSVGALDTMNLQDYMQYGAPNQTHAVTAVNRGIWDDAGITLPLTPDMDTSLSVVASVKLISGSQTNSNEWNLWGTTASVKNEISPAVMTLNENLVDGIYRVSDSIIINGVIQPGGSVQFIAPNGVLFNEGAVVDSSGVMEAIIPD